MRSSRDSGGLLFTFRTEKQTAAAAAAREAVGAFAGGPCVFNFKCQPAVSGAARGVWAERAGVRPLVPLPSAANEVAKDGANGIDFPFVIAWQ